MVKCMDLELKLLQMVINILENGIWINSMEKAILYQK
jgi:hypothetical protein